jgi:hypothetical protein
MTLPMNLGVYNDFEEQVTAQCRNGRSWHVGENFHTCAG